MSENVTALPTISRDEENEIAMWLARFKKCRELRTKVIDNGLEIERYLAGDAVTFERRAGDENAPEEFLDKALQVALPHLKRIVDAMLPNISGNNPRALVPVLGIGVIAKGRSKLETEVLELAGEKSAISDINELVVYEAFAYGLSAITMSFSGELKLPRFDHVHVNRLLWDTGATGLPHGDRWIAEEFDVDTDAARAEWKAPWLKANVSSATNPGESNGIADEWVPPAVSGDDHSLVTRTRLVRLWIRGDVPELDDANIGSRENKVKDSDSSDGFRGKDELVILDPVSRRIVHRGPWPFTLPLGLMPIQVYVPELLTRGRGQSGPLDYLVSVQDRLNWAGAFAMQALQDASVTRGFYSTEHLGDDQIAEFESPLPSVFLGLDEEAMDQAARERLIMRVKNNQIPPALLELLVMSKNEFNELSQVSDVSASSILQTSKTGVAQIANDRSRMRIDSMTNRFEKMIGRCYDVALAIARSLLRESDVAGWVGEQMMGKREPRSIPVTMGDQTVMQTVLVEYTYWSTGMTTADIRRARSVKIVSGSMRRLPPDQQLQHYNQGFQNFTTFIDKFNATYGPRGVQIKPQAVIDRYNVLVEEWATQTGIPGMQAFAILDDELEKAPMPQATPGDQAAMLQARAQMHQAMTPTG